MIFRQKKTYWLREKPRKVEIEEEIDKLGRTREDLKVMGIAIYI